jgi:aminoglycoside 6'-N-acetyltransferase I
MKIELIDSKRTLESCAQILVQSYNGEPWNDNWTVESGFRKLNSSFLSPNFVGLLAIKDGQIIAGLVGNIEPNYDKDFMYLKDMFVLPQFQNTGVGSFLLNALKERLNYLNIHALILFTSRSFFTNQFYTKNGFEVIEDYIFMGNENF